MPAPELVPSQAFRALSASVGADPLQIQGAGGNVSWKADNRMWIKASGTAMADAVSKDIFVLVDLELVRAEIDRSGDGSCVAAKLDDSPLRPSCETTFHGLFLHRMVMHTHSVAALAHVTSNEGRSALKDKLAGLDWLFVPYQRPGLPLTRDIRALMAGRPVPVILLANHGLIVCAEGVAETSELLAEVERRLVLPLRTQSSPTPSGAVSPAGWRWVPECARLACEPGLRELAVAGSYYPDHVVFLGPRLPLVASLEAAEEACATCLWPAVLVQDEGILFREDAVPSARAMLDCLNNVLLRMPADWTMDGLTAQQEQELLGWDAEKYRQALARR